MWRRSTSICILTVLMLAALCACASAARLVWDANTEPHLRGYKIHYGSASGQYTETVDVGNVTEWPIPDEWPNGQTYFFAATAYAECARCPGVEPECPPETWEYFICESGYSNEAAFLKEAALPSPATDIRIIWALIEDIPQMANGFIASQGERDVTGSVGSGGLAAGMLCGQRFQAPANATSISEIGVYCDGSNTTAIFRLGIYEDASAQPGDFLAQTSELSVTGNTPGWIADTGLSIAITGGNYYWLVIYPEDGNFDIEGHSTSGGTSFTSSTAQHGQTYDTWPDDPSHSDRTYDLPIYAVYSTAGASAVPVHLIQRNSMAQLMGR